MRNLEEMLNHAFSPEGRAELKALEEDQSKCKHQWERRAQDGQVMEHFHCPICRKSI